MAEIINLRQQRKLASRAKKEQQAAQNRAQFGRSNAEKQLTQARNDQSETRLSAHVRQNTPAKLHAIPKAEKDIKS
ncbi:DUF4169 family protein [Polycladidibacter hongkongensis]|uniref:DUF4169 family protein n=1 Tax=Polycladidibacter hongkongensis TaxID=1647556 RepID=UPI0008372F49|nr:DUF4169 family protein [Pseudovibrio hongkongensis]